jgi:plasmid maintenance system antidote protein VapI
MPSNRVASIREANGMTQAALAEKLDCHWITVSKLERGEIKLTHDWMVRLGDALGVRPYVFVLEDEDIADLARLQIAKDFAVQFQYNPNTSAAFGPRLTTESRGGSGDA